MNSDTLKASIIEYAAEADYPPSVFETQTCECGHGLFEMYSDEEQGGCGLICAECEGGIFIEGSADKMQDVYQNICSCDGSLLHVMVGKALADNQEDVRWVYVGGQCPECELSGVYIDWEEQSQ